MANWDVDELTPLQLKMIQRTIALRRNKDLGPMELAGLLQEGGGFTPVNVMKEGDVTNKIRNINPKGSTFGLHWGGSNPRIAINTAFPGNFGGVFGHELAHEGLDVYGILGGGRQHDLIGPYLAQNYRRTGKPVVMKRGENPVLRHQQVGQDVSRRVGPAGKHGRTSPSNAHWRSSVPASGQELGLPFTVGDVTRDLAESAEGRRRGAWWANNQHRLMRKLYGQILR